MVAVILNRWRRKSASCSHEEAPEPTEAKTCELQREFLLEDHRLSMSNRG